jgi:uroporphyrinogen-III synthase
MPMSLSSPERKIETNPMHRAVYLTSPLPKAGTIPLPMIDFRIMADEIDYQSCDMLMFTSKQAVWSAEQIDPGWKCLPTVAIGSATAKQIESLGGEVKYHPQKFYGQELAQDILAQFQSHNILYLRPKIVSFDSRAYLKRAGYELKEQIIYKTFCRSYEQDFRPVHDAIIIFTSPSTIHCFLDSFGWDNSYTAVVIGHATVEHLPAGCNYYISDTPLIDACVAKAKTLAI